MALPATEAFTGTGALSASWTQQVRQAGFTLSRLNDQCKADLPDSTDCFAFWNADAFPNDQYSKIKIVGGLAVNHYGQVNVRASGTGSSVACYNFASDGTTTAGHNIISKFVANVQTILVNLATPPVTNDIIEIRVSSTKIFAVINNSDIGSTTDSAVTSGSAGCGIFDGDGVTNMRLDNWEGGVVDTLFAQAVL